MTNWLTLLSLVACLAGTRGYNTEASCLPDCSNVANGSPVKDPRNCRNYYTCVSGIASETSHECPLLEAYDPEYAACRPYVGDDCPTYNPTCVPLCKFACTAIGDVLADRSNCASYQTCTLSGIQTHNCLYPDAYFNGNHCQEHSSQCCDPNLIYCPIEGMSVSDPLTCDRFYYCAKDNYFPSEDDLFHCPDGACFAPDEGLCITGSKCNTIC